MDMGELHPSLRPEVESLVHLARTGAALQPDGSKVSELIVGAYFIKLQVPTVSSFFVNWHVPRWVLFASTHERGRYETTFTPKCVPPTQTL